MSVRTCQGARLGRWVESDRFKNGKKQDRVEVVPKHAAPSFCFCCLSHSWKTLEADVLRTV